MVYGQYLEFYFDGVFLSCSQVCPVRVQASSPLGRLILVRLRLEVQTRFPNLDWHCSRVEVCRLSKSQGSDSETQVFLCDRWLRPADGDVELRSGKCEWRLMTVRRKQRHVDPSTKTSLFPHIILQVCPCKSFPLNLKAVLPVVGSQCVCWRRRQKRSWSSRGSDSCNISSSSSGTWCHSVSMLVYLWSSYSALTGHILESCRGAARSVCELYSVGGRCHPNTITCLQHTDIWPLIYDLEC